MTIFSTASTIILPPITRRIHPQAKRLTLRIVRGQVFLTIPPNTKANQIEQFLQHSQAWLQQHVSADGSQATSPDDFLLAKNSLSIKIINQEWQIQIGERNKKIISTKENLTFLITLPSNQPAQQLTTWVELKAKQYLPRRLAELATQHGFYYHSTQVRQAKTRWGSCNQQGKISLNAGLVLLEPSTLDYVLLHELCHTRQMNHSAEFWAEVARVCPDYLAQRQLLKRFIWPAWWHH